MPFTHRRTTNKSYVVIGSCIELTDYKHNRLIIIREALKLLTMVRASDFYLQVEKAWIPLMRLLRFYFPKIEDLKNLDIIDVEPRLG